MPKMVEYTYIKMKHDLLDITRQISLTKFRPDCIVGITRGGLIPAVQLSHYFKVPLIPVNLSLRDFKTQNLLAKGSLHSALNQGHFRNILVVDDIVDSGETFLKIKEIFKEIDHNEVIDIKYASIYYNDSNEEKFVPDYYANMIDKKQDDVWIDFYYEGFWKV